MNAATSLSTRADSTGAEATSGPIAAGGPRRAPRRRSRMAFAAATLTALAVVVSVAGPAVGGFSALGGFAAEAGAQTCGPPPPDQVAVAVVIDAGGGATVRCVVVPDKTKGSDVLTAAVGVGAIRWGTTPNRVGFVCGIFGVPATGCADSGSAPYWSYWRAAPGGAWTYSSLGVTAAVVQKPCAVEGWRFGVGAVPPTPTAPQVTCQARSTTAPPAPTSPPATSPSGGDGGAGTAAVRGQQASRPGMTPTPGPDAAGSESAVAAGNPGTGEGSGALGGEQGSTTEPKPDGASGSADQVGSGTGPNGDASEPKSDGRSSGEGGRETLGRQDLAAASETPGTSGGPGAGAVIGMILVAALVAVAVIRFRRARLPVQ